MAEQPKEKEKQEEPQDVPFLVYLKGFLLVGLILFGMFFLSRAAENQQASTSESKSVTLNSLSKLKDSFTKEKIQEQIDHEIRTNESYKETVEVIEGKRDEVLGEASKAADQAVETGKEAFFDYMYENTIGALMERFIEQMPEDQKEKLIEKVKEE